jgi:hypothetical protein
LSKRIQKACPPSGGAWIEVTKAKNFSRLLRLGYDRNSKQYHHRKD